MKRSKRTGGDWKVATSYVGAQRGEAAVVPWNDQGREIARVVTAKLYPTEEALPNARTMALAGTFANKLDALGYDGDKAIEALPEIMEFIRRFPERMASSDWGTTDILDSTETEANTLLSRLKGNGGGE